MRVGSGARRILAIALCSTARVAVASGPDGNLWVTTSVGSEIGSTEPDGSVWVTTPDGATIERASVAAETRRFMPSRDRDAPASIIHVPGDQPTIQAGIGAASNGDTVLVAPGTYFENINFLGKAIAVVSSAGPAVTVIDGGLANSVARFISGEGPASLLRGFTLQNGRASPLEGGGIFISSASPTIVRNLIRNNGGCNGGGGIGIAFASPQIRGNVITGNFQAGCSGGIGGGGIAVRGAGSALITGNIVQNNSWSGEGGGISFFAAGAPTLVDNVVRSNTAGGGQGGGIWIVNNSNALILQNLFYGNQGSAGSAIYFTVPSGSVGPLLVNNTLVGAQGSTVFAGGFDDLVHFYNNAVLGGSGQTAVLCDATFGSFSPTFTANDAYSPNGQGLAGTCAPQGTLNGNISADPAFVDAAAGNFRLTAGSPAIDAGTNSAPNLPATDLAGRPRIVDGDGDGTATVDMGAYEIPEAGYEVPDPGGER